jgi:hypothetical protein
VLDDFGRCGNRIERLTCVLGPLADADFIGLLQEIVDQVIDLVLLKHGMIRWPGDGSRRWLEQGRLPRSSRRQSLAGRHTRTGHTRLRRQLDALQASALPWPFRLGC